MVPILLASGSPYRRQLLTRLGIAFSVVAPHVDEHPIDGENPQATALRLGCAKARSVAERYREGLVIGSDQVAELDGRILGKPGDREANVRQLGEASGRRVLFHTALCVINAATGREQATVVPCTVYFRPLAPSEIEAYVEREQAFDCAGGFRAEGLGVALFERIEGEDPSALIGLPLIRLVSMLRNEGLDVLSGEGLGPK